MPLALTPRKLRRSENSAARQLIAAVNEVEDVSIELVKRFGRSRSPRMHRFRRGCRRITSLGCFWVSVGRIRYALLREMLDTRIRSQADVERTVKTSILGTFAADSSVEHEPVVIEADTFSHRAESFRQLRRTDLQFTNIAGGAHRVGVGCSHLLGEGKQTS